VQPGVLAQRRRHGDPALLVGCLARGTGEEEALVVAGRLAGDRRLAHQRVEAAELGLREDVEAALLPAGDHQAPAERFAELGRQEEPALVVHPRLVGAEEGRHVEAGGAGIGGRGAGA
jgi:hypothetical protein